MLYRSVSFDRKKEYTEGIKMMFKLKSDNRLRFECPFCKNEIVSSRKTEIFYRNKWINGCSDCFGMSIDTLTRNSFQIKNY